MKKANVKQHADAVDLWFTVAMQCCGYEMQPSVAAPALVAAKGHHVSVSLLHPAARRRHEVVTVNDQNDKTTYSRLASKASCHRGTIYSSTSDGGCSQLCFVIRNNSQLTSQTFKLIRLVKLN